MATETSSGSGTRAGGGAAESSASGLTPGLQRVFPLGSRVNARGRLEIGGCDTLELAREYGTPAYVVAEDDLRARARAFVRAGRAAGHEQLNVLFASKAFPCTAVLALFAGEELWCDVASGGELHLALAAGFAPERIVLHGNAKSEAELRMALRHRVGLIVIDNLDEIESLERLIAQGALADRGPQPVLVRATPNVKGDTHEKISTGQADSKFGFAMDQVGAAIDRVRAVAGLSLEGVHAHIGSQLFDLEPFRRKVAALAELRAYGEAGPGAGGLREGGRDEGGSRAEGGREGGFHTWDLGGGLGVAYTAEQQPPRIEDYVGALVGAANERLGEHGRLLIEPGRALVANAGVTLYTVQSVKRNVSTWVAVDGGMSDNLRPMLYGARYEAHVADRMPVPPASGAAAQSARGEESRRERLTRCVLAGKHCESGDVIVREALLDDPRPGDTIVTPATGAYGYAMSNNYNGVPRPPVIFCAGGDARVVVRRESFEDMTARDVR
ncbi:MAG TPA: diaminopimelate decarboxylase [Solirubrobacteraceae bacterium]|jgi:diaminopimelate decarboxylase|nr:diaminopimelate decarboxylase [Solirubrobacteraceae bacterium]